MTKTIIIGNKRISKFFMACDRGHIMDVCLTPQQVYALKRMQNNNNHTKVRIKLCELFQAPNYITRRFKEIEKRSKKNNCLSYEDFLSRIENTKILNKWIERTFGLSAISFAQSVQ